MKKSVIWRFFLKKHFFTLVRVWKNIYIWLYFHGAKVAPEILTRGFT